MVIMAVTILNLRRLQLHNNMIGKIKSSLRKISKKIHHGLLLHGIRRRLASIGFEISPYYLMIEGIGKFDPPKIKGNRAEYTTGFLGQEDMATINRNAPEWDLKELLDSLKMGKRCFGVKYKDEIAAFFWINYEVCTFKALSFQLKENEVYFTDMYTMEQFRGKNIAPFLRYQCMNILQEMGKDTFFSVTEYFNTSAVRYKIKLNAEKLKLNIYLKLFKKFQWHFTLRTY